MRRGEFLRWLTGAREKEKEVVEATVDAMSGVRTTDFQKMVDLGAQAIKQDFDTRATSISHKDAYQLAEKVVRAITIND